MIFKLHIKNLEKNFSYLKSTLTEVLSNLCNIFKISFWIISISSVLISLSPSSSTTSFVLLILSVNVLSFFK